MTGYEATTCRQVAARLREALARADELRASSQVTSTPESMTLRTALRDAALDLDNAASIAEKGSKK